MAARKRIGSDFNLGGEQAEADPLLEQAFYEFGAFNAVASRRDPHCFLIGRTGSGKSAIIQRIEETQAQRVIRINPEDLSLPYILDLGVVRDLASIGVHLDPLFIALWKHVLVVELIKHRYNVDSPEAKRNFLSTLRERIRRDRGKEVALDYLEEFGERFWCETDERVREITAKFEQRIAASGGVSLAPPGVALAGKAETGTTASAEVRSEQVDRFQRIVNETQLPRLNKMITVLDDEILESPQHYTFVLIDDLDRDWVDDRLANDLIRCLFRAVLDLLKVRNLKVIVALRTNIFEHLNFGSRTGGQEEKFRSLALPVRWTRRELLGLADERAAAAAKLADIPEIQGIKDLLPSRTKQRGDPFDYILQRTLMRPRDLIAFLNECLDLASGKSRLAWKDLIAAESEYSRKRLLALRDEWKPTFPGLDQVFSLFENGHSELTRDELGSRLDAAALLLTEANFPGVQWMTQMSEPLWDGVGVREWPELYQPLVKLLYDVGFLGIRLGGARVHYAHDSLAFADHPSNLRATAHFLVHPAFRAALDLDRRT